MDYQSSINKYNSLLNAYREAKYNKLDREQLNKLNKQVKAQTTETLAPSLGVPLSIQVIQKSLATKGGKALLSKIGSKLKLSDEDIQGVFDDPAQGVANILDRRLGRTDDMEMVEMPETDTEFFNVDFPLGYIQTTRQFDGGFTNLVESHFTQRPPVEEDDDEFFDASENTPLIQETNVDNVGASTAEDVGAEVGAEVGEEGALEAVGAGLDSTGVLAPIGIVLGITAAVLSFLPFFHHKHHHERPHIVPLPPNLSVPTAQFNS